MFTLTWSLVVLMIAVNALYVAAEFAAVSVRHSRIRALTEEGNRLAKLLLPRIEDAQNLDRYVACCQVGITFSSLVLGAVGQASLTLQLAPILERGLAMPRTTAVSATAIIVLIGLTSVQMVLGELVPKSLALRFPNQCALATVVPMIWSLRIFSWFITLLNGSGSLVLKALGIRQAGHRHIHSPEEIELLIAESRDGGLLEPEEQQRLHQALRLSRRPASQLMVARLHMATVDADSSPGVVQNLVATSPYSRFPVVRGSKDDVIGVLYTKDVIAHYVQQGKIPLVTDVMRPVLRLPRDITADRLLARFRERHCQQAVLVDEYGGVEGLVTLEDVLTEVFGNIADEFRRKPDRQLDRLPDGRLRLSGLTRLDDLKPLFDVSLPEEITTIGGLVFHLLGRLPVVGDTVVVDDLAMEVEAMVERSVASVLLHRSPHKIDQEASE